MAPSRAPLTELNSQVHNRRKMSARQQTYGKHRRPVAAPAAIWESPCDEENAVEKSNKQATGSPLPDADDQLADRLEGLAIASHETTAKSGFAVVDSQYTPNFAKPALVKVKSQKMSTVIKHGPEKVNSNKTSTLAQPVLDKVDSQNAKNASPTNPARKDYRSQITPAPAKPAPSTKLLTIIPVTRRTNRLFLLPIELDVTALLRESYAHTKNTTKSLTDIITFRDFAAKLNKQFAIKKLSDGSFGDVYKLITHSSTKSSSKNRLEQLGGGVLKIIPLAGNTGFGSRKFSRIENVLSEVKVLRRLDALHGFTRFRDVHVVQGRYPDSFVDAYVAFGKQVRRCDAPNPVNFTATQLHAIIDMDDAGKDLESLTEPNIFQIHDIFWAAAIVLAHGEATVEFEARDMHVGNICIRPFISNGMMDIPDHQLSGWSNDQIRHLGLTETRVTLIDYTLSRARMKDGSVAFFDLTNKRFLLPPAGSEPASLQQRAYAQMRDAIRAASASSNKKEDWSLFVPRTNIAWLAYLLGTLLERRRPEFPEASNKTCERAQEAMLEKLKCVLRALELAASGQDVGMESAEELLALALGSQWLNRSEVEWYTQHLESEL